MSWLSLIAAACLLWSSSADAGSDAFRLDVERPRAARKADKRFSVNHRPPTSGAVFVESADCDPCTRPKGCNPFRLCDAERP